MTKVYYSDGTHFEGPNPPPRDVQAILQRNSEGEWIVRAGGDYYVKREGEWVDVDIFGLFDFLLDTGLVLFGRTVTNTEFREVMRRAMADREAIDG